MNLAAAEAAYLGEAAAYMGAEAAYMMDVMRLRLNSAQLKAETEAELGDTSLVDPVTFACSPQ